MTTADLLSKAIKVLRTKKWGKGSIGLDAQGKLAEPIAAHCVCAMCRKSRKASGAMKDDYNNIAKTIDKAADLLSKPGVWIKGDIARTREGIPTTADDPNACQFCALGAFGRVRLEELDPGWKNISWIAEDFLLQYLRSVNKSHSNYIANWNDSRTSSDEVVFTMRAAANMARKKVYDGNL